MEQITEQSYLNIGVPSSLTPRLFGQFLIPQYLSRDILWILIGFIENADYLKNNKLKLMNLRKKTLFFQRLFHAAQPFFYCLS